MKEMKEMKTGSEGAGKGISKGCRKGSGKVREGPFFTAFPLQNAVSKLTMLGKAVERQWKGSEPLLTAQRKEPAVQGPVESQGRTEVSGR